MIRGMITKNIFGDFGIFDLKEKTVKIRKKNWIISVKTSHSSDYFIYF